MPYSRHYWRYQSPALFIWLLFTLAFVFMVNKAPTWQTLKHIHITLGANQEQILGKKELAAASAAKEHIKVGRNNDDWWIENISSSKKVLISNVDGKKRVRQLPLQMGDVIIIGTYKLSIQKTNEDSLTLTRYADSFQQFVFHNRILRKMNQDTLACDEKEIRETSLFTQLKAQYGLSTPDIYLGGLVDCENNIALKGVAHRSLRLKYKDGYWHLMPANSFENLPQNVIVQRANGVYSLRTNRVTIKNDDLITAGYSQFIVKTNNDLLTLTPIYRSLRSLNPDTTKHNIEQIWQADLSLSGLNHQITSNRQLWKVIGLSLISMLAFPFGYYWAKRQYPRPKQNSCLFFGASLAMMSFSAGQILTPLPMLLPFLILALSLLIWTIKPESNSRTRQLRLLVMALLSTGALVQLQLGLGAAESHWYNHAIKTSSFSACLIWILIALSLWIRIKNPSPNIPQGNPLAIIVCSMLLLLGLQTLIGYEGGLGIFQPVEMAKIVLIVLTASVLAQRLDIKNRDYTLSRLQLWWHYLAIVLFFLILFIVLLQQLNDHSPLVLLAFWAVSVVSAYIYISRSNKSRYGAFLLPLVLCAGILGTSLERDKLAQAELLPQSERFSVWAAPDLHPHTGYQFNLAQKMIQRGGFSGHYSEELYTHKEHVINGPIMNLPAVQDDFMPSFALYQFGGAFTLSLVLLQCMLIFSMVNTAREFHRSMQQAYYRKKLLGNFCFLVLVSGAGILAGHFIVSWGTNLGFLPVMGQPMPLLSSAGSNLLFFCMPLFAITYLCSKEIDS